MELLKFTTHGAQDITIDGPWFLSIDDRSKWAGQNLRRQINNESSTTIILALNRARFHNVVCGFITKESPLMLCHLIKKSSVLLVTSRGQGRGPTVILRFAVRYISRVELACFPDATLMSDHAASGSALREGICVTSGSA
ncbi:hypothetical protein TIFTF001_015413 [Ficus carica]|uniref:Uncharacterized protein n=1 Tax=Ficus carica TaxID=3494 RepID=A0AA88D6I3_FICCA|nr:hypothetical protein TIFTF001_015413 [Ficus carica]